MVFIQISKKLDFIKLHHFSRYDSYQENGQNDRKGEHGVYKLLCILFQGDLKREIQKIGLVCTDFQATCPVISPMPLVTLSL